MRYRLFALLALFLVPTALAQPCEPTFAPGYHFGSIGPSSTSFSDGAFQCAATFDDGAGPALYAGGNYTFVPDQGLAYLTVFRNGRWHAIPGFNSAVRALTVVNTPAGQRLYAAGSFTTIPGNQPAAGVAVFDGQSWSRVGTQAVTTSPQAMIAVETPGGHELYVGGGALFRWDGSTWTTIPMPQYSPSSSGSGIRALAWFDDGAGPRLFAAISGHWDNVFGVIAYDGSSWSTIPGLVNSLLAEVSSLAVVEHAGVRELYLGGFLFTPGASQGQPLAKLVNGAWQLIPTTPVGFNGTGASALLPFSNGDGPALAAILGNDGHLGKTVRIWQSGGWTNLPGTFLGPISLMNVRCLTTLPATGELCVLGPYDRIDAQLTPSAAYWHDNAWRPLEAPGLGGPASTVVPGPIDSRAVYIGPRRFTPGAAQPSGLPATPLSLVQWNDPLPTLFLGSSSGGFINNGSGYVLEALGEGAVRLWITNYAGVETLFRATRNGISQRTNGAWVPFGPPLGTQLSIIGITSVDHANGPALYVGGTLGSSSESLRLARLAGNQWEAVPAPGIIRAITAFDLGAGPELIIATTPDTTGGPAGIFAWNGSTLRDASAGLPTNTPAYDLRTLNLGAGPQLWCAAGNALHFWNGAAWQTRPQWSANGPITSIAATHNADGSRSIFATGSFTLANGILSHNIAELRACSPNCTSDFDNDGDSGTDADIEAFFACLAGTCCPTCGTADFNNDGDTGTDADIEAFFRVLAGGTC
jgi:hypothetical protein